MLGRVSGLAILVRVQFILAELTLLSRQNFGGASWERLLWSLHGMARSAILEAQMIFGSRRHDATQHEDR